MLSPDQTVRLRALLTHPDPDHRRQGLELLALFPTSYRRVLHGIHAIPAELDLTGQDLHGLLLVSVRGRHLRLSRANLHLTDLRGADLRGANLRGADLRHADLRRAVLSRARLEGADVRGAQLDGARIHRTVLRQIRVGADTSFDRVDIRWQHLEQLDLSMVSARYARMDRTTWRGCQLSGINLHGAYLDEATFIETDLREAQLSNARLNRAHLQGADLRGANLRGAQLEGACLRDADLRFADLRGATLIGCALDGARLGGARLSRVRWHAERTRRSERRLHHPHRRKP